MDCIVIPVYERPEYLKRCLNSLQGFKDLFFIFADDGSKDANIELMCRRFLFDHKGQYTKYQNAGIGINMLRGLESCSDIVIKGTDIPVNYDVIITLDSDFIVKPDFVQSLKTLLHKNDSVDTVVTGFNATSHPIIEQREGYAVKKSIGGGNLCFTWETYVKHIRPNLIDGMWDWRMVNSIQWAGGQMLCTTPSVCQSEHRLA